MPDSGSATIGILCPVVLVGQSFCSGSISESLTDGRGCRLGPPCVGVVLWGRSSDRVCRGEVILTVQVVGGVIEGAGHQSPEGCGYVSAAPTPCDWDKSSQPAAGKYKQCVNGFDLCTLEKDHKSFQHIIINVFTHPIHTGCWKSLATAGSLLPYLIGLSRSYSTNAPFRIEIGQYVLSQVQTSKDTCTRH